MGQVREVDAISDAIIATEREIAGEAWDIEDTDPADVTGDRSLEDIGGGLEGQQEPEDDEDVDGEEAEGDEESEGEEGEGEGEAEAAEAAAAAAGKVKPGEGEQPKPGVTEPEGREGRVPSGKLRVANEARRVAEAERDQLKADLEAARKVPDNRTEIETLKTQVSALTQMLNGRQPPKAEEPTAPKAAPDIFENPTGFVDHLTGMFESKLSGFEQRMENNRVETSMALAHATHKDAFENAFAAMNKLDPRNPDDRVTVQRIAKSPNPGEALVGWHKRQAALAEVGDDPAAYRARVAEETRQALLKDPEFRKQLVADMRGEAAQPGPDGRPRSTTRLPGSLARAGGSNLGAERTDARGSDDSEQSVADAAWR